VSAFVFFPCHYSKATLHQSVETSMQRTLIDLPLEIRREIDDYLSLGDPTRFTRTCKSIARVHISRLYDCSFSPEVKLTAAFIAAQRSEFVLEYVAAKADKLLARRDYPRSTLLQGVVQADNELWLDIFIKHGIDINCLADDGWSLLHTALGLGCDKGAVKLLDAGADVLFPAAGRYPTVGLAVNEIPRATIDRLLAAFQQAGGDISAPGPDGICTALHYTSRRGSHLTARA
jgi:hypothetical protein